MESEDSDDEPEPAHIQMKVKRGVKMESKLHKKDEKQKAASPTVEDYNKLLQLIQKISSLPVDILQPLNKKHQAASVVCNVLLTMVADYYDPSIVEKASSMFGPVSIERLERNC